MKHLPLFLFLFNFSLFSFAQDGPKVVVFNSQPEEDRNEPSNYSGLIKLSLLDAVSGDLSMYYERLLQQKTSFEFGLGVTVDDYLSVLMQSANETTTTINYRKANLGYSFGLGFRYYPFKASEEIYFAPEFKHRRYNSTYTPEAISYHEQKSTSNFRFTVGYVYFFDKSVFIDYYGGLGLGIVKTTSYDLVTDPNTFINSYEKKTITSPKPTFTIGVKIGFAF